MAVYVNGFANITPRAALLARGCSRPQSSRHVAQAMQRPITRTDRANDPPAGKSRHAAVVAEFAEIQLAQAEFWQIQLPERLRLITRPQPRPDRRLIRADLLVAEIERDLARGRRSTGGRLTDLGPLRAARRQDLLDLGIADRRFGWPLEMVFLAARAGWRIDEGPVAYRPRVGRSKVTGSVGGYLTAVRDTRRRLAEAGR